MDDERLEQLLRGYRPPEVSRQLDHRVRSEGGAILAGTHLRGTLIELGRSLLQGLGFGYVIWLVDLVTTTDAEYRVELI
jgi:hypothetical protein